MLIKWVGPKINFWINFYFGSSKSNYYNDIKYSNKNHKRTATIFTKIVLSLSFLNCSIDATHHKNRIGLFINDLPYPKLKIRKLVHNGRVHRYFYSINDVDEGTEVRLWCT